MTAFEVPFSDGTALQIVRAAFGHVVSRLPIKVRTGETYHVADYWDGGSRTYCGFVELATLRTVTSDAIPLDARQERGNPYNLPILDVELPPGVCVVEHVIFCGKDRGYRIVLRPENVAPLLPPAGAELPPRDRRILYAFRSLKSGPYRQEALQGLRASSEDFDRLVASGHLSRNRAGAMAITSEGRAACANER